MRREIAAYAHRDERETAVEPDGRPGFYYVSVRSGDRCGLLYGPFGRHAGALAAVEMVRKAAMEIDGFAAFYAFGTARLDGPPAPPGILNHLLPDIGTEFNSEIQNREEHHETITDG